MLYNGSECKPLIRGDLGLCMHFQEFLFIAEKKDKNMTLRYHCDAQTGYTHITEQLHITEERILRRISFFFYIVTVVRLNFSFVCSSDF